MRLIIAAAGTGGHIIPALNIASYLQQQKQHSHSIHWIGTSEGMENRLVPQHDIPMHSIDFSGVRKKGIVRWLLLPINILKATVQAYCILTKATPDVVLVMGGYVSVPTAIAAYLKKIPLVIHEQNSIAGLANKVCSLLAKRVCYAFPNTLFSAFSNTSSTKSQKFIYTGNPVHPSLVMKKKGSQASKESFHLLILGGSLGARTINSVIPEALAQLQDEIEQELVIIHQCGKNNIEQTQSAYQSTSLDKDKVHVLEFSNSLAEHYQQADLIIARAGAMSVAEISTVGTPALFIPYPYAVNDHQYYNAQSLLTEHPENAHRYAVLQDQTLAAEEVSKTLHALYQNALKNNSSPAISKHASATNDIANIIQHIHQLR